MEKKTKRDDKAVALSYDQSNSVPRVVAKGEGLVARNIVEKGIEEDIVIYEDKDLVDSLIGLDLDEEIPEELYEAVAEIIFYVYKLDIDKGR